MMTKTLVARAILCSALLSQLSWAGDYSPALSSYPKNVYWGDTHLHTRNSPDAYTYGNQNLSPADAYRYARGEEYTAHNGMRIKIKTPLDFLVVADHAEYLGGFYRFGIDDSLVTQTAIGRKWREWTDAGNAEKMGRRKI